MEPTSKRAPLQQELGPQWPLLIVLALLAALAASTVSFWGRSIAYPYALENGEGFVLDSSLQVARGLSPYHDLEDYPLTVGNYPPLAYWLNALAVARLGPSYAFGRALSVAAALAAAALLGWLAASLTGEPLAGWLAALYYLTHPTVRGAAALLRVDTLAGALAFGGLVFALKVRGRAGLWAAAALFAAGLATKHSAVVAPAAACVGVGLSDLRRGLTLAWLTAACTAGWVALGLVLYGPTMVTNLGPYTATPVEAGRILAHLRQLPREYLPGLVALPLATLWSVRRGGPAETTAALYGWLGLTTLATLGKHGSSLLYLSELTIGLALAVGLAAGWGLEAARRLGPGRAAAALAAGGLALLVLRAPPPLNPIAQPLAEARALWAYDLASRRAEDAQMVALLKAVEGPVLAESPDLVLAAGKTVVVNPFVLKWAARMGLWDEGRLLQDVARHHFAAVQLDSPAAAGPPGPGSGRQWERFTLTRGRFSPSVLEAVERHYRPTEETPRGLLYRPRSETPTNSNAPGAR